MVIGDGALAFLDIGADPLALPAGQFGQRQIDASLPQLRHADDDGPIDLARRLFTECPGQERRRRSGAGDDENAAGILVEPMDEARPDVGAKAQRVQQPVEVPFGPAAALDGETGRLVQHDHRIVAVQHRVPQDGFVAGRGLSRPLRNGRGHFFQRRDTDDLTRRQAVTGAGALTVDPDPTRAQQLFEMAMAERGVVPLEPAVETKRPVLAGDSHGVGRAHRHRVSDPSRIVVTPRKRRGSGGPEPAPGLNRGRPYMDSRFRLAFAGMTGKTDNPPTWCDSYRSLASSPFRGFAV